LAEEGKVWAWGESERGMGGGSHVPALATALSRHVVHDVAATDDVTYCFCNDVERVFGFHISEAEEGLSMLHVTTLSAEEVAVLQVNLEVHLLGDLRSMVSEKTDLDSRLVQIVLQGSAPEDARVLSEDVDHMPIAQILRM